MNIIPHHPLFQRSLRLTFIVLLFAGFHLFFLLPCLAGQTLTIDSDKQFEYAEKLFSNGKYPQAIDEYNRFIHFFPKDIRVHRAQYNIGLAYYNSRQYEAAIESFQKLIHPSVKRELFIKAHWRMSESHIGLRQFGAAIIDLENLITLVDDRDIQEEAYYRIGWIYIETASFEKAKENFNKISADNRQKFQVDNLFAELKEPIQIPQKNPTTAGVLSIIPGAGYVYTERYRDAFIAFLINAAFAVAAYESFDNDLNALGTIIGVVGIGFYAGNIYGATTSAHKYNRRQTRNFIEDLKQNTKIQLSGNIQNKGISVALQYKF